MNRGFASIGLVVLLFAALAIGGGGYWVMTQPSASIESSENSPTLRDYTSSNPQPPVQQTPEATQIAPKPSTPVSSPYTNGSLTVSTQSGSAPLTVTFSIQGSAGGQLIDFGDGSNPCSPMTPGFTFDDGGCHAPASPKTFTHTYTASGTYTVKASRLFPSSTLGIATITVGAAQQGAANTSGSSWQTHRGSGFEIKYPPGWRVVMQSTAYGAYSAVSFGPAAKTGHGYDGDLYAFTYDKSTKSVEQFVSDMGAQFSDRIEKREQISINGVAALKVTVTTASIPSWISEAVIVEQANRLYVMSNGAVPKPEFVDFYKSFKLL